MEISKLDQAILDCIQSVDSGDGSGCGWLPSVRTESGLITNYVVSIYPALIQYIDEEKETDLSNGDTEKEIQFYFVNPKKGLDALEVRSLHDTLNYKVKQFKQKLNAYYKNDFVGQRERLVDQLPILEAGILFTLRIQVDHEC